MELTGRIDSIGPEETVGANGFRKREFVLEVLDNNPQYSQFISFQFVQDKCQILDQYQVGMEATVHFDIRGRKWTNREGVESVWNTLQAWRIQQVGAQPVAPHNATAQPQAHNQAPAQPGPTPQTQQMLANAGMTATVQNPPPTTPTETQDQIPF